MNDVVPRSFFTDNMKVWNEDGYDLIDFSRANVDLRELAKFYYDKFEATKRKVEKNYLLNYLLINNLAYYRYENDTYKFYPRVSA